MSDRDVFSGGTHRRPANLGQQGQPPPIPDTDVTSPPPSIRKGKPTLIRCPACKRGGVSSEAARCPKCGHQLTPEQVSAALRQHKAAQMLAGGCLLLVIIGAIVGGKGAATQSGGPGVDNVDAWVMAQRFVEKKLVSPGTAEYGWQTADQCVRNLGEGRFFVHGWVDAQNRLGAKIRADFTCVLKYLGNDKWECERLTLDER